MGKKPRPKRPKKLKKRKMKSTSLRRTQGKISDALVDVAKPLLVQQSSDLEIWETDLETWEKIMTLTMVAWNAVVTEEETGEPMLSKLPGILAEKTGLPEQACAELIVPLAARKMAEYPNDRRFVMNVQVSELDGGRFYVTAASMAR